MKEIPEEKVPEDVPWSHFFRIREHFFQFPSKIFVTALHDIIGLQISHCLSANHNPELRYVIISLVLHSVTPVK